MNQLINHRHATTFAVIVTILLAGCVARSVAAKQTANVPQSLGANGRLPAAEIQALYSPQQWERLRDEGYKAYLIVEAEVSGNKLARQKIIESYPDNSRNGLALALLKEVDLKGSTVGTHLVPRAAAYVVFYDNFLEGETVLIYAKQVDYSEPGEAGKAEYFDLRKY